MGREVDIPWVEARHTMGRGRYTLGRGVDITWVGGRYIMVRG